MLSPTEMNLMDNRERQHNKVCNIHAPDCPLTMELALASCGCGRDVYLLLQEVLQLKQQVADAEAIVDKLTKYYQQWVYFGDGDDRLAEFVQDLMDELGVETETQ